MMPNAPETFHYNSQCAGKIRHATEADARKAASSMRHASKRRGKARAVLNAYKCHHCDGYHLGRIDPVRKRSDRLRGNTGKYTVEV